PELAGRAEGVGRNPGDDGGAPVRPELPLMRVRPHVRRIVSDEDRHVADDADAPVIGVAPELEPLPEEDVLEEPVRLDAAGEVAPGRVEGAGRALGERGRPRGPASAIMLVLEGGEQGVVVEPRGRGREHAVEITL